MFGSGEKMKIRRHTNSEGDLLPKRVGRVMAAGPGPANSAAIGPRLCRMVRIKNWFSIRKSFFRINNDDKIMGLIVT